MSGTRDRISMIIHASDTSVLPEYAWEMPEGVSGHTVLIVLPRGEVTVNPLARVLASGQFASIACSPEKWRCSLDTDAIFISCTSFSCLSTIESLVRIHGKPVLRHRLAGTSATPCRISIKDMAPGYGQLLTLSASTEVLAA